jgi:hypothetical protein
MSPPGIGIMLNFNQMKNLSLHDAKVISWKLDVESRILEVVLHMAYSCSKEYGKQGMLLIKDFQSLTVVRWPDDKRCVPVEDPKLYPLVEIINEEFSEKSYELSAMGETDWLIWKFTWETIPDVTFTSRRQ